MVSPEPLSQPKRVFMKIRHLAEYILGFFRRVHGGGEEARLIGEGSLTRRKRFRGTESAQEDKCWLKNQTIFPFSLSRTCNLPAGLSYLFWTFLCIAILAVVFLVGVLRVSVLHQKPSDIIANIVLLVFVSWMLGVLVIVVANLASCHCNIKKHKKYYNQS